MVNKILKNNKLRPTLVVLVNVLEFVLGVLVAVGTIWYVFVGIYDLVPLAGSVDFYLIFINILLTAIIGAEVVRLLITHDLFVILEILAFVLARKVLSPDTVVADLLIVSVAFLVLIYARKFLVEQTSNSGK